MCGRGVVVLWVCERGVVVCLWGRVGGWLCVCVGDGRCERGHMCLNMYICVCVSVEGF